MGACSRNPLSIVSDIVQSFDLVAIPRACDLILIRSNFVVCPVFFNFESFLLLRLCSLVLTYGQSLTVPIIFKFEGVPHVVRTKL